MSEKDRSEGKDLEEKDESLPEENATNLQGEEENKAENATPADNVTEEAWETKFNELNDSHLRLRAEFDNYRKRTLREKADLIKNGGESALTALLPVIDDFERALQNVRKADNIDAVREGIDLIYTKFIAYLAQQGVKAIEATGKPFDTELFEAVATIPAPEKDMKGKVLDNVQTGYTLYDKVIRHAKVVVGE